MKKAIKRAFITIFALTFICVSSGFTSSSADLVTLEDNIPISVEKALELQAPALEAYEKLTSYMEESEYVDKYAGEYIDANGKLVVQLVNPTIDEKNEFLGLTDNSSCVTVKNVKFTIDELKSIESIISSLEPEYDIVSYGVDIINNKYMVTILKNDYNNFMENDIIKDNIEMLDISSVSNYPVTCATSLYGGDGIQNDDGLSYSVGIGGTYNGKNAILTAGHDNEGSPKFYRNGNLIGSVSYQRCNKKIGDLTVNSLGDFAIITLNNSYTPTNRVRNATSTVPITGTYSSVPVGTTVYKYGAKTGYAWGIVNYVGITVNFEDGILPGTKYQIRGLYQATMSNSSGTAAVAPGDSGGAVYVKDGSNYKIQGIVSGFDSSATIKSVVYSSPMTYAQDIGFKPKTN